MGDPPIRRRIAFDAETWHALNRLALDSGNRLQDLAGEAFRDFLRKHCRPVTLRDAFVESVRMQPATDRRARAAPLRERLASHRLQPFPELSGGA